MRRLAWWRLGALVRAGGHARGMRGEPGCARSWLRSLRAASGAAVSMCGSGASWTQTTLGSLPQARWLRTVQTLSCLRPVARLSWYKSRLLVLRCGWLRAGPCTGQARRMLWCRRRHGWCVLHAPPCLPQVPRGGGGECPSIPWRVCGMYVTVAMQTHDVVSSCSRWEDAGGGVVGLWLCVGDCKRPHAPQMSYACSRKMRVEVNFAEASSSSSTAPAPRRGWARRAAASVERNRPTWCSTNEPTKAGGCCWGGPCAAATITPAIVAALLASACHSVRDNATHGGPTGCGPCNRRGRFLEDAVDLGCGASVGPCRGAWEGPPCMPLFRFDATCKHTKPRALPCRAQWVRDRVPGTPYVGAVVHPSSVHRRGMVATRYSQIDDVMQPQTCWRVVCAEARWCEKLTFGK